MYDTWLQTQLLYSKCWKTKLRTQKLQSYGEVVLLMICISVLVIYSNYYKHIYYPVLEPIKTAQDIFSSLEITQAKPNSAFIIYIVPDDNSTRQVGSSLMKVLDKQQVTREFLIYYINDSKTLHAIYSQDQQAIHAGIVFPNNKCCTNFSLRINPFQGDLIINTPSRIYESFEMCREKQISMTHLELPNSCPVNSFFYSNFLALQTLIYESLAETRGENNFPLLKIGIENYPKQKLKGCSFTLKILLPIFSSLSMIYWVNNLLFWIVTETKNKIRESLHITGFDNRAYWASWFLFYGIVAACVSTVLTFIITHFYFKRVSIIVVWITFWFFGASIITFAFLIAMFFEDAKIAGIVGFSILQIAGLHFITQELSIHTSEVFLFFFKFISSVAFTSALSQLCEIEFKDGLTFSEMIGFQKATGVFICIIYLIIDIFLYAWLASFLHKEKMRYLQLQASEEMKTGRSTKHHVHQMPNVKEEPSSEEVTCEYYEPVSAKMKVGIVLENLWKSYMQSQGIFQKGKPVKALKSVNVRFYQGEITQILGQSGSGKSTLLNLILGMIQPTKGTVTVLGRDVNNPEEFDHSEKCFGVCFQYDFLFDALTVEEHLLIFGQLRGLEGGILKKESHNLMKELYLWQYKDKMCFELSRGIRRILCTAVALIGDPRVVIMDHPCTGVDLIFRRHLLSFLQLKKKGRVILFSTPITDQSGIIADRQVILNDGCLKCVGTSLYIKSKFGVGYHLKAILKNPPFKEAKVDEIIFKWVPPSLVQRNSYGDDIEYILPYSSTNTFPFLLRDIEEAINDPSSNIARYEIRVSTLEEVLSRIFSKIGEKKPEELDASRELSTQTMLENEKVVTASPSANEPTETSIFIFMCQIRLKRLLRNSAFFIIIFISIFIIGVGFALMDSHDSMVFDIEFRYAFNGTGRGFYPEKDMNIAYSWTPKNESVSESDFVHFMSLRGVNLFPYSGNFTDLFSVNPGTGTMASIQFFGIDDDKIYNWKIRFNGTYVQSPPWIVGLINDFTHKSWTSSNETLVTELVNKPFRFLHGLDLDAILLSLFVGPSFTMTAAILILEIVADLEIKMANLLRLNGFDIIAYFGTLFAVVGAVDVFLMVFQLGLLIIFCVQDYCNYPAIITLVFLLLLYIPACLAFSAILAHFIDDLQSVRSSCIEIFFFAGMLPSLIVVWLDAFFPRSNILYFWHYLFSMIDVFYVPFGIFFWVHRQHEMCVKNELCQRKGFDAFWIPELMVPGIATMVQTPVFGILLYLTDTWKHEGNIFEAFLSIWSFKGTMFPTSARSDLPFMRSRRQSISEDVQSEAQRVEKEFKHPSRKCVVAVKDVTKCVKISNEEDSQHIRKIALNQVSFKVDQGEIFGILGHMGAGKSTLIKIITAEILPTKGEVIVCGKKIDSRMSPAFKHLGYCPQTDVLWDNITVEEHILMICTIRKINYDMNLSRIQSFLLSLGLFQCIEKRVRSLSRVLKRKLCFLLSILGNPAIVLIDEPGLDLDSQSKRFLWDTISENLSSCRSAILATYAIEEAEALCNRIAIISEGKLLYIGSPQRLKSEFGKKYTLDVKFAVVNELSTGENISAYKTDVVKKLELIKNYFPNAEVTELFQNRALLTIPLSDVSSVSESFENLEELKASECIDEYSFSQTSFDQLFRFLSKK